MTRRGVMRATAVGIGAAAGMGAIGSTATPAAAVDWSDVGTIAASALIGGPLGLGWAIRETEVLGSNPPAEGLTGEVAISQSVSTLRKRKSTLGSTIVDNQNILDGVENTAYTEAKIAAIEELNAGASESDVLAAATGAIDTYETTVKKNLLKSFNEAIIELRQVAQLLVDHADATMYDVFDLQYTDQTHPDPPAATSRDMTMPDGSTFTVERFDWGISDHETIYDPAQTDMTGNTQEVNVSGTDGTFVYLEHSTWTTLYSDMDTKFQNVRNGISTWVTNVYSQVQTGEIGVSDLITPRERAAMLSEEESQAQAIADLAALNIPVDSEREATVTISETGATLSGTIGLTDSSDGPIESGTTYDPSTFAGDVYLTADVSQITGTWDAYQSGVDGGTITLTSVPYEGVILDVTTTAGETVSVPASDWTDNGDGTWSYDASADLETTITEVDSVAYASADSETQYETLELSRSFTVDKLVNRQTGEEESSASFESSEPQDDSNYITQDEWDQLEQQNQELIEKYEESQNTGDGGGGGGFLSDSDQNWGVIAIGAGALAVGWGYITGDEE